MKVMSLALVIFLTGCGTALTAKDYMGEYPRPGDRANIDNCRIQANQYSAATDSYTADNYNEAFDNCMQRLGFTRVTKK